MTLPAFCCWAHQLSNDISCRRPRSAANPPAAVAAVDLWDRHTHSLRQTDGRTFDRYIDPALHTMRSASMKPRICAPGIHLLADSKRLKNAKRRWLKKYACWLPSSWLNEHWTGGDVSLRKVFSEQFTERNDTIQIGLQKTRTDLGLRALKTWRKSA